MNCIKEFIHNGKTVRIMRDENPESPADWSNLGEILYMKGSRYTLGYRGVDREEMDYLRTRKDVFSLPVFAYVHSGSQISLTPYSCPWDSGQSGIIYATHEAIRNGFVAKRPLRERPLTDAILRKVRAIFKSQVDTFSDYLQGNVYGYTVENPDGSDGDSCWGFYGMGYCEQSAREAC